MEKHLKKYAAPSLEVFCVDDDDVIRTSGDSQVRTNVVNMTGDFDPFKGTTGQGGTNTN